jgi:hypothetical protein
MSTAGIQVGIRGKFHLSTPFDQVYDSDKVYTCKALRSLHEMVTSGDDPLANVYERVGLTNAQFQADLARDVNVAVLVSTEEEWIQVPTSYILSIPDVVGVEYQNRSIVINLGALPVNEQIQSVLDDLAALVKDRLGLQANTDETPSSDVYLIDWDTHQRYLQARNAQITTKKSYRQLWQQCQIELSNVQEQLLRVECYISARQCQFPNMDPSRDDYQQLPYNYIQWYQQTPAEADWLSWE